MGKSGTGYLGKLRMTKTHLLKNTLKRYLAGQRCGDSPMNIITTGELPTESHMWSVQNLLPEGAPSAVDSRLFH